MSGSLFALGYAIYQMLQVGTCASGGPYVSARPCPGGTAAMGLTLFAAIIVLLIGAGIWATRGKAPGSDNPPRNDLLIVWVWTGIFWSIALGCFLAVWGPNAHPGPGGKEGALIVGFLFVPMGAGGLIGLMPGRRKRRSVFGSTLTAPADSPGEGAAAKWRSAFSTPGAATAKAGRIPESDPVERLERLQKLRDTGTVNEAEFQRLKAEILGGG